MKKWLAGGLLLSLLWINPVAAVEPLHLIVTRIAVQNEVPVNLALAILETESGMRPNIIVGNHYGLGQVNCTTAREMGFRGNCRKLLSVDTNLIYSMQYLSLALERTNGNWCHAATLYNQGINARPRYSRYCRKVLTKAGITASAMPKR